MTPRKNPTASLFIGTEISFPMYTIKGLAGKSHPDERDVSQVIPEVDIGRTDIR
jgi:hypothetical protein